jgi:hypothetical protein
MALGNTRDRRHDLAGSAVATLECVLIDECLLHRMELATRLGQAFYCLHAFALRGRCQREARNHSLSVHEDSACATLTLIAALFGACQMEMIPQGIEQRRPGVDAEATGSSIYIQLQRRLLRRCRCRGLNRDRWFYHGACHRDSRC